MEANIPEGLHKQSIDNVAGWISSQGFNCVRLTYSIDMALNPGLKVSDSFRAAAGAAGVSQDAMMGLYNQALQHNPSLSGATVLDVFGAVIDALWNHGVMTILDNHVSKASWCCDLNDGNGWWSDASFYSSANSRFFDTNKWLAGLQAMATWSRGQPGIVAMSIRNEMRATWTQFPFAANAWRSHVPKGAMAIHKANPDVLVIIGGLNGATDFTTMRDNAIDLSGWRNKNVWEAHMYSYSPTAPNGGNCDLAVQEYGGLFGFVLEQGRSFTGPLFLSEFGVGMTGGPENGLSQSDHAYLSCLVSYMEGNDADWSLWAIQGSYYVRNKVVDFDETWGALNHDWTDWRNPQFKAMLGNMFQMTQHP
jgi:endoglucanase